MACFRGASRSACSLLRAPGRSRAAAWPRIAVGWGGMRGGQQGALMALPARALGPAGRCGRSWGDRVHLNSVLPTSHAPGASCSACPAQPWGAEAWSRVASEQGVQPAGGHTSPPPGPHPVAPRLAGLWSVLVCLLPAPLWPWYPRRQASTVGARAGLGQVAAEVRGQHELEEVGPCL